MFLHLHLLELHRGRSITRQSELLGLFVAPLGLHPHLVFAFLVVVLAFLFRPDLLLATPHLPVIIIGILLEYEAFLTFLADDHLDNTVLEVLPGMFGVAASILLADLEGVVSRGVYLEREHLAMFVVLEMGDGTVVVVIIQLAQEHPFVLGQVVRE